MKRRTPPALDGWLEAWRVQVTPERFPDLDEWIPAAAGTLGPGYWRVMRDIWEGTAWRRFTDSARLLRTMRPVDAAGLPPLP